MPVEISGMLELELVDAGLEVGDDSLGRALVEDEMVGAAQSRKCLFSGAGKQEISLRAADQRVLAVRADDELPRLRILRFDAAFQPGVPCVGDEDIVLDMLGIGVAEDDVGKR